MNFLESFPKIKSIWNKLNKKQKRLILAAALSVSALGTVGCGCSEKDNRTDQYSSDSEMDDINLENLAKKYGFHPEQVEIISPEPGDTLSQIAERYGMSLQQIIEINGIENPNFITTDMNLMVIIPKRTNYDSSDFTSKIDEQGYTKGIDISAVGQANIDLKTVLEKNDIDFVMVRMAYFIKQSKQDQNRDCIDDAFDKYAKDCADANVPMGIYFWPSIVDVPSAKREVDIITNKLDEIKEKYGLCLEMPVCIDIETEKDGGGKVIERLCNGDKDSLDALEYVINTLEERGYFVMVYTGNNCLKENPKYRDLIKALDVDTLIPKYTTSKEVSFDSVPNVSDDIAYDCSSSIRQYTQWGKVIGYNGDVDFNVCYTDFPKIIKNNNLNGFTNDRSNILG